MGVTAGGVWFRRFAAADGAGRVHPLDDDRLVAEIESLRGTDTQRLREPVAEARDWARYTTASCDLVEFPGGHFFIVDHVRRIVEPVAASLV